MTLELRKVINQKLSRYEIEDESSWNERERVTNELGLMKAVQQLTRPHCKRTRVSDLYQLFTSISFEIELSRGTEGN